MYERFDWRKKVIVTFQGGLMGDYRRNVDGTGILRPVKIILVRAAAADDDVPVQDVG
jgi:hypothetical protein